MRAPIGWLNEYLSKQVDTKTAADALEAGGIEVEQILYANKLDEHIIVAEIKKLAQHPNADKLQLATVFDGKAEIELVCGASNLKVGSKVAFAQVGSVLADGTKMKLATIRGQVSPGMLATARELGVGDDHTGLCVLPGDARLGTPVNQLFQVDDVIDVTTQANRFDLLSISGLAREISAQTSTDLKSPLISEPEASDAELLVTIEAKTAVRRMLMIGLKCKLSSTTPPEVAVRLEQIGSRAINPIVDATNYLMHETGQPLHAFDASKLKFPLSVRYAKAGETLVTLDNVDRKLTAADLVIADSMGPLDLAGIMGGKRAEVTASTTEIILVSGTFDGATVRKMAKRQVVRTEASARFERGLPSTLGEFGLNRALHYFKEHLGSSQTTQVSDTLDTPQELTKVVVEPTHISKILSIPVSAKDLARELPKLGFEVTDANNAVEITIPWWRTDVQIAEDIAEEYIRLVGYDKVPARLPKWQPSAVEADSYWPALWQLKDTMKGLGYFEVITYSFVSKDQLEQFGYKPADHLKLKNPMSSEQAYLRQNLLPSLMTAMVRNQGYRAEVGIYEVSQVFIPTKPGQQPEEPKQLGVLYKGHGSAYAQAKATFDRLQSSFNTGLTLEPADQPEFMPERSALIKSGGKTIGRIGELHPKLLAEFRTKSSLAYLEIDIEAVFAAAQPRHYQPISRFPSIYRDLAVVLARDVMWQDVSRVILAADLATPTFLNDYYDKNLGTGKKSLAMRLEMTSQTATLTDKEANKRLEKIVGLLNHHFNATLRS